MNRLKRLLWELFPKQPDKVPPEDRRGLYSGMFRDYREIDEDEFDMRYPGAREFHEDCGDR